MIFINGKSMEGSWQSFERLVCRFLLYRHFKNVRIVGTSGDKGADVIAHNSGKRWIIQVKRWNRCASAPEVQKTVLALSVYGAEIPVVICKGGFDKAAKQVRDQFVAQDTPCQLWDADTLLRQADKIEQHAYPPESESMHKVRDYQEQAIKCLVEEFASSHNNQAMIVMATGLGKTRVMCEFIRRLSAQGKTSPKVLVLAHTNDLVYQLERAFWHYLRADQQTAVWNGLENTPYDIIKSADLVFGCLNTVALHAKSNGTLPDFDIVLVDECHHVGREGMYSEILDMLNAGQINGPFLAGVTATPWRPDEHNLSHSFGTPLMKMDLVAGLRGGLLANVDYRMFTTYLDWSKFSNKKIRGKKVSPQGINRNIFISEWDDGVIDTIEKTWLEQKNPRAIVFCGTVSHAQMMRDRINARGFCRAEAVFSGTGSGEKQAIYERNKIISDFQVGKVQIMCCVDIFNEGIDVPDVNIVVFQRVTHSRRIFVQQLGRGLRLAPDKDKVIVLDFVSDVRRFAAGIELKDALRSNSSRAGVPIRLNHKIEFHRYHEKDEHTETFMREWLNDITAVVDMGKDKVELQYPNVE